jgi:hypothetical protein
VPLRVAISEPCLLGELTQCLRETECVVAEISDSALEVVYPAAGDPQEARVEVTFFLRAWQLAHPAVDVVVG